MDHPLYLAWALMPQPVFGYRGPLATSGIENLRDGKFRRSMPRFGSKSATRDGTFPSEIQIRQRWISSTD